MSSWLLPPDELKRRQERERQDRIRRNAQTAQEYKLNTRDRGTSTRKSTFAPFRGPEKPTRDMTPVILTPKKLNLRKDGEFADVLPFDQTKRRRRK